MANKPIWYNKKYQKNKHRNKNSKGWLSRRKAKFALEDIYYYNREVRWKDDYKCACCNTSKSLSVHHIFYQSRYPELRRNINNGITLCKIHNREVHALNDVEPLLQ